METTHPLYMMLSRTDTGIGKAIRIMPGFSSER